MRIGVAGAGYWARTVHMSGVAASTHLFEGVWGRDITRTSAAAAAHGVRAFDDFDAFLDAVDVVSFALPPHIQAPLAARAAAAGKHLLLEKPISLALADADQLVEAAADVATVVFFTNRFVRIWEDWLDSLRPAHIDSGRAEWLVSMTPTSPYAGSRWRQEHGALWDVGPHALSVLLPVLGPVASVTGARGRGDHVELVLAHESGALSTMSLTMTLPTDERRIAVEFRGSDGIQTRPEAERDIGAAYASALAELLANAEAGRTQHRCDVRFGREVVDVLSRCEAALS